MLDCDWCENYFAMQDLFNVDYVGNTSNVLCAKCVDEAHKMFADTLEGVWQ